MITPYHAMSKANEHLKIFSGLFSLTSGGEIYPVKGIISYSWLPSPKIQFEGEIVSKSDKLLHTWLDDSNAKFSLQFSGNPQIDILITSIGESNMIKYVSGIVGKDAILGDSSIDVDELHIDVANLKDFLGDAVKFKKRFLNNRLSFTDHDFTVKLDKIENFGAAKRELMANSGYQITYAGIVKRKKSHKLFGYQGDL